ncbi:MAG: hypothetical protein F6K11_32515 [Leptolyngbya sp. SIO3F4]|nr:hypothetical protein [Leptolyngbya sp. SIO3F4]
MLKPQTMPVWIQPTALDEWPTQNVTSEALKYRLPICQRWQLTPIINQTPMEQEHIFLGTQPGELLTIGYMAQANPNHDLQKWVETLLHITGLPILHWQSLEPAPKLIEWQSIELPFDLCQQMKVDEILSYQGLAQAPNSSTGLLRIYSILLRRHTEAWKIHLSLSSACLPGVPEEMVERNDHVRAGATFGFLQLL